MQIDFLTSLNESVVKDDVDAALDCLVCALVGLLRGRVGALQVDLAFLAGLELIKLHTPRLV